MQIDRLQAQIVEDNQVIEGLASEFAKLKAKDDEIMAQLVQAKDLFVSVEGALTFAAHCLLTPFPDGF